MYKRRHDVAEFCDCSLRSLSLHEADKSIERNISISDQSCYRVLLSIIIVYFFHNAGSIDLI